MSRFSHCVCWGVSQVKQDPLQQKAMTVDEIQPLQQA